MPARIRLKSTTSEVGWLATAHFVRNVLAHQGLSQGLRVFVAKMVQEPIAYGVPTLVRRYGPVILFGLLFAILLVVLIPYVVSPADLVEIAANGTRAEKLGLARLTVAVLTFTLALVGSLRALGQIRKDLARPDLYPTFESGSTYRRIQFDMPRASGDKPFKTVDIYLRNVSEVAAKHAKVVLTFDNHQPFEIQMKESLLHSAVSWQRKRNGKREEWEFRPAESLRVYGEDDYHIGRVHINLPTGTLAGHLGWDLPRQQDIQVYPVVHDDWGRRQRPTLWLSIEARYAPSR